MSAAGRAVGCRTGAGLAVKSLGGAASRAPSAVVAGSLAGGGSSLDTGEVLLLIWGASEGLQLHRSLERKIFALLNGL